MALPESRWLDVDEIPVIDIRRLHGRDGRDEIIRTIDRACIAVSRASHQPKRASE